MGIQGMFPLTHWHSCALTSIQGVFNTDLKAFTWTHKCSGHVQYWLKGVHAHSHTFRECSVLTQMRTFSLSHHDELHSIMTELWWCVLNWCSGDVQYSLIGIYVHSMGVQRLFALTQWHSYTLNRCSVAITTHSLAFMCTYKCSGGVQYMFSLLMYLKA